MSRTYKDRPWWVKRNDRSRPGREVHNHREFYGYGPNARQLGECTISEPSTRENSRWRYLDEFPCYWEPDDAYCGHSCAAMSWTEETRRLNERMSMLQYVKEYNSGEEELSFEDDVFSTNRRHDWDDWWCC